jgi:uncharacterized protein
MDIVKIIRDYVEWECKKPTSKYGYEPFPYHFEPMVKYAEQLTNEIWWDKEIILIAAWLHDVGSIIYGREDHHITWAKVASEKLKELNYPKEKIELIEKCILNHRWSKWFSRLTIEEQIISEADTMSAFENIAGIFKAAYVYEDMDQWQAKESVKNKLENKWKQLCFQKSKEIIKPKYDAAMLLLS